jgi:hypothetical protein
MKMTDYEIIIDADPQDESAVVTVPIKAVLHVEEWIVQVDGEDVGMVRIDPHGYKAYCMIPSEEWLCTTREEAVSRIIRSTFSANALPKRK